MSDEAKPVARVYLDNAATTRLAPEVREAMEPFLDACYYNPSAVYAPALEAAAAVSRAREQVAALIGAQEKEVHFTSGATESNNWALMGALLAGGRRGIVVSAIEHHAVLDAAHALTGAPWNASVCVLPVDSGGRINPADLADAVNGDTAIVSIMHANNEIGTVQPVRELSEIAHAAGALFHTDAVQSAGKIAVDVNEFGADLLSLSAHKLHGPKGIGALYIRKGVRLPPLFYGGSQEFGQRPGTSNVPGIAGFGKAAELAAAQVRDGAEAARQRELLQRLWRSCAAAVPGLRRNSPVDGGLPNILNMCVPDAEGEALLLYLDMAGICVASGSACSSRNLEPSHVLRAIGVPAEEAHGALRISLSRYTTTDDVAAMERAFADVVRRVQAMSARFRAVPQKDWQP